MNTKVDTFIKGLADLMSWHDDDWASDWKFKEELAILLDSTFTENKDITKDLDWVYETVYDAIGTALGDIENDAKHSIREYVRNIQAGFCEDGLDHKVLLEYPVEPTALSLQLDVDTPTSTKIDCK